MSLGQRLAEALLPPLTADDEAGIRAWRFSGLAGHGKTTMIARLIADAAAHQSASELRMVSANAASSRVHWPPGKLAELAGNTLSDQSQRADARWLWCAKPRDDCSSIPGRQHGRCTYPVARRWRTHVADVVVVSAAASAGVVRRVLDDAPAGARIALTQLDLAADQPGESLTAIWREIRNGKRLRWFLWPGSGWIPSASEHQQSGAVAGYGNCGGGSRPP
ncbi:MAG: hypothetical protein R3E84_09630 [Pseudomonadales bacterium]